MSRYNLRETLEEFLPIQERRAREEKRRQEEQRRQREEQTRQRDQRFTPQEQRRQDDHRRKFLQQMQAALAPPPYDAISLYETRLHNFSKASFSLDPSSPVKFSSLPWPILKDPKLLHEADITFAAVDQFFEKACTKWIHARYRSVLRDCQLLFHQDRWSSRKIGQSIADEALREAMERSFIIVSKAVTARWQSGN
ncbi:hypothetical protein C8J56DRAFT_33641 [Mycena floridula]|nr:hypothetical protein C8J56DRAFT_33641 [Mycena floridula]